MSFGDLVIRRGLVIPAGEITERFSASGGPGGQHANRSNTRVELRFDIAASEVLSNVERDKLTAAFGGDIRVVVDDERSQTRNREIARERLTGRIRMALTPTRPRRPTRPTKGSKARRLDAKRRRGEVKRTRQRPGQGD